MTDAARKVAFVGVIGALLGLVIAPVAIPFYHAFSARASLQQAFPWAGYDGGLQSFWLDSYSGRLPLDLIEVVACMGASVLLIAVAVFIFCLPKPSRVQEDGAFGSQRSESSPWTVAKGFYSWRGGVPDNPGFVVGFSSKSGYLVTPCKRAVFIAPSKSGKSRDCVVPSIACITQSGDNNIVVSDPSLELFCYTQKMLRLPDRNGVQYRVILLDLEDPFRGDRINFLLPLVRLHQRGMDYLVEERAIEIGAMLFPETGSDQDAFMQPASGVLAAVAYIVSTLDEVPEDCRHLYTVIRIILEGTMANSAAPLKRWIRNFGPDHPATGMAATFLASTDRYEASILGTLHLGLKHFNTSAMRYLISGNGFDPEEFLETPSALFIHTLSPGLPGNKACSLTLRQLWEVAARRGQRRGSNIPTYFILDEAHSVLSGTSFPLAHFLENGRKHNMFISLYLQSLSGLDPCKTQKEDGKDAALANCDCKCLFRAGNNEDARYFEEISGSETLLAKNTSQSRGPWDMLPNSSVGYSERERAVWMKGDLMQRDPLKDGILVFQNEPGQPQMTGKFEVPVKDMTEVPFMVDLLGTIGSRSYEARVITETIDALDARARIAARDFQPSIWIPAFPEKSKGGQKGKRTDRSERDDKSFDNDMDLFGL